MQLAKYSVVLAVLIARICESAITIEVKKPDECVELEQAAVSILTNCYGHHKTAALIGDHPGKFIERLSYKRSFSLILVHDKKRTTDVTTPFVNKDPARRMHKIHVVVVTGAHYKRLYEMLWPYVDSANFSPMSAFLALGWSPQNNYRICDGQGRTLEYMSTIKPRIFLNFKMMCQHRGKRILMYNSNWFTNEVPEPWKLITSVRRAVGRPFRLLGQLYYDHEGMCKNLDFDKTRDWGWSPVKLIMVSEGTVAKNKGTKGLHGKPQHLRWRTISQSKAIQPFVIFCHSINATPQFVYELVIVGVNAPSTNCDSVDTRPTILKAIQKSGKPYAYPIDTECGYLLTQYRGNKTQWRKIFDVIDGYSWIGIFMVYVITLIFFKYFLRQSLIVGIMNLARLTSNFGLTLLSPSLSTQIYLSCLLFLVVTVQGIFVSNLAALLTNDIPVRQVNSRQDLIDLGYKIHIDAIYSNMFDEPVFKGRVMIKLSDEECTHLVLGDPLAACITSGPYRIAYALSLDLYVGTKCLMNQYSAYFIPHYWALEEKFNKIMAISFAAGILTPFETMVDEKRLIEYQSLEVDPEPRIMTLADLAYAFTILGIGLSVALSAFMAEIIHFRFVHRVKTTPVLVLN